jgi:hypothetical protein
MGRLGFLLLIVMALSPLFCWASVQKGGGGFNTGACDRDRVAGRTAASDCAAFGPQNQAPGAPFLEQQRHTRSRLLSRHALAIERRVTALICVNDIVFLSLEHGWLPLHNTGETWGSRQNSRRTVSRPRMIMLCKELAHEREM